MIKDRDKFQDGIDYFMSTLGATESSSNTFLLWKLCCIKLGSFIHIELESLSANPKLNTKVCDNICYLNKE